MLGDFASLDVQNTYRGSDAYASCSTWLAGKGSGTISLKDLK
ncbi:hypothetical protein [Piscirickettsia salmonis]|nr:hypothetical protein [Piscirickettsia salmonis]